MHWPRRRHASSFGRALTFLLVLLPAAVAADEEQELPAWIPSIGLGAAFQSRSIDGEMDAFLYDGATEAINNVCAGGLAPPDGFAGFCDFGDSDTRSLDGTAIQGSAQLLGPPLDVFLQPRPFVHGGFDWLFDSRTIAESGLNPESFNDNGQEPDTRTRLRGNPEYLWYAGGGVALQMPVDFTNVFVKLGAHYMQERTDVIGQIDRQIGDTQTTGQLRRNEFTDELTIPGVGPSFGVEAEVYRFGPVALNFVADVFVTFPLSGTDSRFEIEQPKFEVNPPLCSESPGTPVCVEPATFEYDADSVHWLGAASLRFSWVGD